MSAHPAVARIDALYDGIENVAIDLHLGTVVDRDAEKLLHDAMSLLDRAATMLGRIAPGE